jgi:thioredoxin 1
MYKNFSELGVKPEENRDLYSVTEITDIQHKNQILSQNRVVLVDIFTNWCGPCKKIEPEYSLIASKYNQQGVCAIVKENLEKKITSNIHGVPTFHIYKNGQLVDEIVGADLPKIEEKLQMVLDSPNNQFANQHDLSEVPNIPQYHKNNIRQSNPNPYKGQSEFSGQPYKGNPSPYHQPYQGTQIPQAPQHQMPQSHQYQQAPQHQAPQQQMPHQMPHQQMPQQQMPQQQMPQYQQAPQQMPHQMPQQMNQSRQFQQIPQQSRYPSPNVQYNQ